MTQEKIKIANLVEDRVFIATPDLPKEQVLGQLVKLICQAAAEQLNFEEILKQILAREMELSTTLDSGLSLPHVRVEGFDKALGAVGVLPKALQDMNEQPIKAVFLFITPVRSEFFQLHLQILASAVETFSPALMEMLSHCSSKEAVLQLLSHAGVGGEII